MIMVNMSTSKTPSLAQRKKISDLDASVLEKKKEVLQVLQHEMATPLTSADQHLQEVKICVERLKAMAAQFEEAGSQHRRKFSLQVQHDALQSEIRNALQIKADAQAAAGIPEEQNLRICQAFVDDILVYLAKAGIRINPLNVTKVRKSRRWE